MHLGFADALSEFHAATAGWTPGVYLGQRRSLGVFAVGRRLGIRLFRLMSAQLMAPFFVHAIVSSSESFSKRSLVIRDRVFRPGKAGHSGRHAGGWLALDHSRGNGSRQAQSVAQEAQVRRARCRKNGAGTSREPLAAPLGI